jgi:hypothetical protein
LVATDTAVADNALLMQLSLISLSPVAARLPVGLSGSFRHH